MQRGYLGGQLAVGFLREGGEEVEGTQAGLGVDQSVRFLAEVDDINLRRRDRVVDLAVQVLSAARDGRVRRADASGTAPTPASVQVLNGTRIAVLGVTFKPDSDDVRDSPALDVANRLYTAGADVRVYDPEGNANAAARFPRLDYVDSLEGEPAGVGPGDEQRLGRELAVAGGVPAVVRAVEGSYRLRSAKRTSWPVLRWMHSFRADPLRRLHLMPESAAPRRDRDEVARDPALHRTSLPERSGTQRAVVDGAVRTLAAAAGAGASEPWAAAIRRAGREHAEELPGAVDRAIAATDLGAGRGSWWHPVLDVLQWLALLTAVVGAGWLGVLALAGYLQFPLPPAPTVEGFPLPTLLLVGGLALGVLLALLAIPLTRWTAAARGRRARRRLEEATTDVGRRLVVDPVRAEVERFHAFRDALARASGVPVRRGRR